MRDFAKYRDFETDLRHLINQYSIESYSDTPDYQLAEIMTNALKAFEDATIARSIYYGKHNAPCGTTIEIKTPNDIPEKWRPKL